MKGTATANALDQIDHVAIRVGDIDEAVAWYMKTFKCEVAYKDGTWAMLRFGNIRLALVVPSQHPPHIGIYSACAEKFGDLRPHRDGTRSTYIADPSGNWVEVLAKE
ncbi:MAG: VOC family protein [Planctomycetota bacterium]|nr:MAG: VOC family protein [Planctomycetota bacterium]